MLAANLEAILSDLRPAAERLFSRVSTLDDLVPLDQDERLALLADCGHLPHVECPDRFATVLSEWLAERPDPS